jgi:hypothetical protein
VAGPADLLGHDEIGALEDPDVLLDAVDGQLVRPCQVADGRRAVAETLEDPAASGVG